MADLTKILLTASMTVLGGFIIHFASQIFLKIFIEPVQAYKKQKSKAISLLSFYSNMLDAKLRTEDSDEYKERYYKAQDEIRLCMANIKAAYYSISPRWLSIKLGITPNEEEFHKITSHLLSLSFLGHLKVDGDKMFENGEKAKETLSLLGAKL